MWLDWALLSYLSRIKRHTLFLLKVSKFKCWTFCPKTFRVSHYCFVDDNELRTEVASLVRRANVWIHPGSIKPKTVLAAMRKLHWRHPYQRRTRHWLQMQRRGVSVRGRHVTTIATNTVCDNRHLSYNRRKEISASDKKKKNKSAKSLFILSSKSLELNFEMTQKNQCVFFPLWFLVWCTVHCFWWHSH